MFPTLFLSHGAPDLILGRHPAAQFLRSLGTQLPRPRAIVMVSAHWVGQTVGVMADRAPTTIHDFGGFADELYCQTYCAPGSPELANQIMVLLRTSGIDASLVSNRGFDHGAWIPLKLIYPEADIPVVQVGLPAGSLSGCAELGKALAPLRAQEVLIIGSGGSTHNLGAMRRSGPPQDWVAPFEKWLETSIHQGHFEHIADQAYWPAEFSQAHPSIEHYAPLPLAWGAGGTDKPGRLLHRSIAYGSLSMSHYIFGEEQPA